MAPVTMSQLGNMGRWGNQLFQYAALSAYAGRYGASFEHPPWIGQWLFGTQESPITQRLPRFQEARRNGERLGYQLPPNGDEAIGRDFVGYCQWHTSWWKGEERGFWSTFRPTMQHAARAAPAVEKILDWPTSIGLHIRRGDYGQGLPWDAVTPTTTYLNWLKQWWPQFREPRLFIASEDRSLVSDFAEYEPETVESLGVELLREPYPFFNYLKEDRESGEPYKLDFWPEWECLRNCDVLVCANSTFSFTAALCGLKAPRFFRFDPLMGTIAEEDAWNTWPLLRVSQC